MNSTLRIALSAAWMAVTLTTLPSCKKRTEAAKADLDEAGYQLTAEDWFRASRGNDVEALKKFTVGGFSKDTTTATGDSALHEAASDGALGSAEYLLNQGLAVDRTGAHNRTPLMVAVMKNQTEMVKWLLRQGADPQLKDAEGFKPLMLAVREGSAGSVEELAPYDRGDLDSALLLAALVGRADVIDSLTNFGASVYARMEDGRTPLMIAAENGHADAATLLLEIGSSRYAVDTEGRAAAQMATEAGHPEIAAMINREPAPTDLTLDSPEEIAAVMDEMVDTAIATAAASRPGNAARTAAPREASRPIEGEILSAAVPQEKSSVGSKASVTESFPMPPLVMRTYREKPVPVAVRSVQGDTATLRFTGATTREVKVRAGDQIPGSDLVVVRVRRRLEESKVTLGTPTEISVVEVRDERSGATREWISGILASAHDPVALVEDSATGKRYVATPGQRFRGADGASYVISEVRPNQLVIQESSTGAVQTIPLRGPRG